MNEDRPTATTPVLHHREHPLGEIGRQRGGDLVKQQELRIPRHRSGEIDHPQERQRNIARLLTEVDLDVHRSQPLPDLLDLQPGEADVLRDRQVGYERRILEHGREPDAGRLRRRRDADRLAAQLDAAAVALDDAREDLDERALAGAVRAEERVDLPASTERFADSSATTGP